MCDSKLAPGPWTAERYVGRADNWFVRGADGSSVCGRGAGPITEVHARAISAIPELVDALLSVRDRVVDGPSYQCGEDVVRIISEALEKAGITP